MGIQICLVGLEQRAANIDISFIYITIDIIFGIGGMVLRFTRISEIFSPDCKKCTVWPSEKKSQPLGWGRGKSGLIRGRERHRETERYRKRQKRQRDREIQK